jgi:hypothetical protein
VKLLARLLYLPVKLGLSAVESAFQAGRFAGEVSVSAGRGTTRLLGVGSSSVARSPTSRPAASWAGWRRRCPG